MARPCSTQVGTSLQPSLAVTLGMMGAYRAYTDAMKQAGENEVALIHSSADMQAALERLPDAPSIA